MKLFKLCSILSIIFFASNAVADARIQFTPTTEFALSSSEYHGIADAAGTTWSGELGVEILSERAVEVPILPISGVLAGVTIDGKVAAVLPRESFFAVLVQGKGSHQIQIRFTAPIEEQGGQSAVRLATIKTPVSRYQLTIPGQKEVRVTPNAVLGRVVSGGKTIVTVNMPMSSEVLFNWSNILPDGKNAEAKLHATLYHFALPEEGVLSIRALISYELLRGEVSTAEVSIPAGFEVTRVQAPGHTISDWRVTHDATPTLFVTFQEPIKSDFIIDCNVERSLAKIGAPDAKMIIAPLRAEDAARQRGIIALLAGKEVALSPLDEHLIMQVGENQIESNIRALISQNVLHTFKYLDEGATLTVSPITPEHKAGRFDAIVHTLFSLGDVSIKGSVKTHIEVKAGSIQELALDLPLGVSVLNTTAPSMRSSNVETVDGKQRITIQFTQAMEGAFPVDVLFERLLSATEAEPALPTLHVEHAEVEQGKFAVEALTAVEVQTGTVQNLGALELNEVPQEIRLQTTNPLLLAFKYSRLEENSSVTLKVTRHQELETQTALVDLARYETLMTLDGLSVTTAKYTVRNTKSQFLRLLLPKNSSIWSVTVQGENVKPARAEREGKEEVLIKILNSAAGFPVEITYATPQPKMRVVGLSRIELPKTDLIVTRTQWNLYMPDEFTYGPPHTALTQENTLQFINQSELQNITSAVRNEQNGEAVTVGIPTKGTKYTFSRIFSNQAEAVDGVTMAFISSSSGLPRWLSILATATLGLLIAGRFNRAPRFSPVLEKVLGGVAFLTLVVLTGYFRVGISASCSILIITAGWIVIPEILQRITTLRRASVEY